MFQPPPSVGTARRLWRLHGLVAAVAALFLMAAWTFTEAVTRHAELRERGDLSHTAAAAAASLDPVAVTLLAGGPADRRSLQVIRERLRHVRAAVPGARFAYLVTLQERQVVFLADAEPEDSPDYSPPGQIYDEAPPAFREVLSGEGTRVSGPYNDRWGQWLTGIAAVGAGPDGRPLAALGIDVDAARYEAAVASYRTFAAATSALFALSLALATVLVGSARRFSRRLAADLDGLREAHERLRLAGAVVDTMNEGLMVTDQDLNILSVNPAFERITGFAKSDAVGRKPSILFSGRHDDAFFNGIRAEVGANGSWRGEIWNRRRDGALYPQRTSVCVLRDALGRVRHYASLLSDDTAQKQLEQRLRELSSVDGLTGIANRRAFDEALEREWTRARREGRALSLLMADIDHFKAFNDLYGHPAGDRCLREVAGAIAGAVNRSSDLAARYGGEEFAVILPTSGEGPAASVAERVRAAVAALALPHAGSSAAASVTISVGVATLAPDARALAAELVALADRALYEAKHAGRNRVISAHAPDPVTAPAKPTLF